MREDRNTTMDEIVWIVLKVIVSFALIRIITRGIKIFPGNYGIAFSVALFTFWIFRWTRETAKDDGYTLSDCRVTRIRINWKDIAFVFGFLAVHYSIMSLMADRVYATGMKFGEIIRLSMSEILHSGIGSGFNEELVFRGYLLKTLEEKVGIGKAIGIVSVVFGLAHALNGGMTGKMVVCIVIGTGMLGALFAVLAYETGSIWRGVLLHAACNLSSLVIDYENGNCLLIMDLPAKMTNEIIFCTSYFVISLVCCGVIGWYWWKNYDKINRKKKM